MPSFVDKEGRGGWVNPGDEWKIPYFIRCETPPLVKPEEKQEKPIEAPKEEAPIAAEPSRKSKKRLF